MLINVSSLKNNKLSLKGNFKNPKIFEFFKNFEPCIKDLDYCMDIQKKDDNIHVSGDYKVLLNLNCVKCLKDFDFELNESFEEYIYYKKYFDSVESDIKLNNNDLDYSFLNNDELNSADIIKEQILLSIPDYPVCNAECQQGNTNVITSKINGFKDNPFSKLKDLEN